MVRKGTHLLHNFGSKRREFVDQLEDLYQEVSQSFIRFFGSRGRLHHWWTGARAAIKNAVSPGTSSDEDKDEDSFDGRYHQERSLSTDSLDSSLNSVHIFWVRGIFREF
ncbi:Choline-phosphate cytidylyltransferase A [Sparganum proliferum]